jgi:hypothetical protein
MIACYVRGGREKKRWHDSKCVVCMKMKRLIKGQERKIH